MNRAASRGALCLRDPELSPQDRADLEAYYAMLRSYFEVPANQPLFPETDTGTDQPVRPSRRRPCKPARNRADHPWRAKVGRRQP